MKVLLEDGRELVILPPKGRRVARKGKWELRHDRPGRKSKAKEQWRLFKNGRQQGSFVDRADAVDVFYFYAERKWRP